MKGIYIETISKPTFSAMQSLLSFYKGRERALMPACYEQ
jgi:hypothetical protein